MAGRFSAPAAGDNDNPRIREISAAALQMAGIDAAAAADTTGANRKVTSRLLKGTSLLSDSTTLAGGAAGTATKLGG